VKYPRLLARLGLVGDVVIVLGLLSTWVPLFASLHWFPALFDHFRLQMAIAGGVALVLLLVRRSWRLAAFAVVTLGYHVWPLASVHRTLLAGVTPSDAPALKLVCFNVLFNNTRTGLTLKWLKEVDADVIIFLESSPAWEQGMRPLRETHPHGDAYPASDCSGLSIYSRLPLTEVHLLDYGRDTMPGLSSVVEWAGKKVRLVAVHPLPPTGSKQLSMMGVQLDDVARRVRNSDDMPSIVTGDFNCTPWARPMRDLQKNSGLGYRSAQPTWRPTWRVGHPLCLAIDHTLCTEELFIESREIGPDLGSDHRPQVVVLRWAGDRL
jgi:endonuclease/exonuclease/phosphatase (EEP) superfamily protein YafD